MVAASSFSARNLRDASYKRASCSQVRAPRGVGVDVGVVVALGIGVSVKGIFVLVGGGETVGLGGRLVAVKEGGVSCAAAVFVACIGSPWQALKNTTTVNKLIRRLDFIDTMVNK